MPNLKLGLPGLTYENLFEVDGLKKVDDAFFQRLQKTDTNLKETLLAYRNGSREFSDQEISELLISGGRELESFVGQLFGITAELDTLRNETTADDPIFQFKKNYVLRKARRRLLKNDVEESFADLDNWLTKSLKQAGLSSNDRELSVAKLGRHYFKDKDTFSQEIEFLIRWCILAMTMPDGKHAVEEWVSFDLPSPVDYNALVPTEPVTEERGHRVAIPPNLRRRRDGFKLTDLRMNQRRVQSEVDYCIYCHDHEGDFCSKGFPVKKGQPEKGYKTNPLAVDLVGCPLDEKISEMHFLKKRGAHWALCLLSWSTILCAPLPVTGSVTTA